MKKILKQASSFFSKLFLFTTAHRMSYYLFLKKEAFRYCRHKATSFPLFPRTIYCYQGSLVLLQQQLDQRKVPSETGRGDKRKENYLTLVLNGPFTSFCLPPPPIYRVAGRATLLMPQRLQQENDAGDTV